MLKVYEMNRLDLRIYDNKNEFIRVFEEYKQAIIRDKSVIDDIVSTKYVKVCKNSVPCNGNSFTYVGPATHMVVKDIYNISHRYDINSGSLVWCIDMSDIREITILKCGSYRCLEYLSRDKAYNVISSRIDMYKEYKERGSILDIKDIGDILGYGNWGCVYSSNKNYVLKFSKSSSGDKERVNLSLIRDLIINKRRPNLPLLYGSYISDKSIFKLRGGIYEGSCNVLLLEKCRGTLKDCFDRFKICEDELGSIIFQVLCGLYSIHNINLVHFDIKRSNILYYKVPRGGFWLYKVNGVYYKIPNYGRIFVLNDFGVSRLVDSGKHPSIFYNDIQDVIRMFTGGNRSVQKGKHPYSNFKGKYIKKLCYFKREWRCCRDIPYDIKDNNILESCYMNIGKIIDDVCSDFRMPSKEGESELCSQLRRRDTKDIIEYYDLDN